MSNMISESELSALLHVEGIPGIEEAGEVAIIEPIELIPAISNAEERGTDLSDDYASGRNILSMAEQLALKLAQAATSAAIETQSPRQFEVANAAVEGLTKIAKAKMGFQKDMNDVTGETKKANGAGTATPTTINANTVTFVGSPAALMAKMGSQYDAQEARRLGEKKGEIDVSPT